MNFTYENIIKTVYSYFFEELEEGFISCPINTDNLPISKINGSYVLEYHKSIPIFANLLKKTLINYDMSKTNMVFSASNNAFGKNLFDTSKNLYNSHINIFYPENNIEKVYELMMTTDTSANTNAIAVKGDMKNCKEILEKIKNNEKDYLKGRNISFCYIDETNPSILIPRILYLFFTYKKMVDDKIINPNEKVNIFLSEEDESYIDTIKHAATLGLPIENVYMSPIADLNLVNQKIKEIFTEYKLLIEPYTACSLIASKEKCIVLSLTSPYIYARTVDEAIRGTTFFDVTDEYSFFEDLSLLSRCDIPKQFLDIYNKRIMHYDVLDKENLELYITKLIENYC